MSDYVFKNTFGKLTLYTEDRFLIAKFEGSVSESAVKYFLDNIEQAVSELKTKDWGYISYSEQAEAATPEALKLLIEAAKQAHLLGCKGAAYILHSPIAVAQTAQMRKALGIEQPINGVLFDNIEQAKQYLSAQL